MEETDFELSQNMQEGKIDGLRRGGVWEMMYFEDSLEKQKEEMEQIS
jgi:hypothetical protein